MKTMFLFMAIALFFGRGVCQSLCGNLDFENGNFNNWKTYCGHTYNIDTLSFQSFDSSRFAIMSGGYDSNTGFVMQVVAPGGSFSCRLGNSNMGAEAEKITYSLTVNQDNALFIYKYAIVLQDPGHSPEDQPQFEVKILNENGEIADTTCGYYQVFAAAALPGFQNYGMVVYKDWTTVGIDLSPYIGQNVTICFISKDCGAGGHFGYAYIDAESSRMEIKTFACAENDTIVMAAPFGFEYLWQPGGYKGRVFSVAVNEAEESYSCTLTSVTGCRVMLTTTTEIVYVDPEFTYLTCDSVRFLGESSVNSAEIDSWNWNFGDGQSSSEMTPLHYYNGQGPYNVQLTVTTNKGCTASITKTVSVTARPFADIEPVPMCAGMSGEIAEKSMRIIPGVTKYFWDFGDGSFSHEPNPSKKYEIPGVYTIKLTLVNGPGCKDVATSGIEIFNCEVQLPNVITPNSDGLNETFVIKNLDVCSDKKLSVFNRWGTIVYSSEEYGNNWHPDDLTSGVYYYIFEFKPAFLQDMSKSKTGFVTILK